MSLFEVGRMVLKVAGRDAGRKGVVVRQVDDTSVLIDGDVRRKKVNVRHLEPLEQVLEIEKGAAHEQIAQEFEKLQLPVWSTQPKAASARPEKKRKGKKEVTPVVAPATLKKEVKVEARKEPEVPPEEAGKKEVAPETAPEEKPKKMGGRKKKEEGQ